MARSLSAAGARVVLVKAAARAEPLGPGRYAVPLEDAAAVRALVHTAVGEHGAIGGVVHLAPLDAPGDWQALDAEGWHARLAIDVKALFALLRAAGGDIQRAPSGVVLAATALGGAFGLDGTLTGFPGHGGVVGLVKTVAAEWPDTRVKVVDLDGAAPAETLARQVWRELGLADGEVEVGHARCPPRRAPRAAGPPRRARGTPRPWRPDRWC